MNERATANIQEIAQNRNIKHMATEMLNEIKPNAKSAKQYFIAGFIAVALSYLIVYKANTVLAISYTVEILNGVALAMIAIIFGTYAIFQALMTDTVLWALLKSENNLLNISNKSFLNLILLYLTEIILNTQTSHTIWRDEP